MNALIVFLLCITTVSQASDYDYTPDGGQGPDVALILYEQADCDEDEEICRLVNKILQGIDGKINGERIIEIVDDTRLACARGLEKQKREFASKIEVVRGSLRIMNETLDRLNKRQQELEEKINSTKTEISTVENQNKQLSPSGNNQYLKEKRRLENRIAEYRLKLSQLEFLLEKLTKEKKNLEEQMKLISDINNNLTIHKDSLIRINNETSTLCALHIGSIEELQTELNKKSQQLDVERASCDSKLDHLEEKFRTVDTQNKNNAYTINQCKKVEDDINSKLLEVISELNETKSQLKLIKFENDNMKNKINEAKLQEERSKFTIQTLIRNENKLKNDLKESVEREARIKKEKDLTISQKNEIQMSLNGANAQIKIMEKLLDESRQKENDLKIQQNLIKDENEKLKIILVNFTKELNITRTNLQKANEKYLESNLVLHKVTNEINICKTKSEAQIAAISEQTQLKIEELENCTQRENDIYAEYQDIANQLNDTELNLEIAKTRANELEEQAVNCDRNKLVLEEQIEIVRNQSRDWNMKSNLTEQALKLKISQCKRQEEMYKTQARNLQSEKRALENNFNTCSRTIRTLQFEKENVNRELAKSIGELSSCYSATSTTTAKPIPKGAVVLATGVYILNPVRLNWSNARQYCTSHGMDLVAIESEEENNLLASRMLEIGASYRGNQLGENGVFAIWTSGCYSYEHRGWVWQSNRNRVNFSKWDRGQEYKKQGCIMLWANDMKWWQSVLATKLPSICELGN